LILAIITRATQTAITFISDDIDSSISLTNVEFIHFTSSTSGGGLYLDIAGSLQYNLVLFTNGTTSQSCTGMELHVRPTFYIDTTNGLSFTNLIAAENGGGMCVYTTENSTFNFDNSISFTNTYAKHGGALYLEGPGSFMIPISNYGQYSAKLGAYIFAKNFQTLEFTNFIYSASLAQLGELDSGIIYAESNLPNSEFRFDDITFTGMYGPQENGGGLYLKDIQTVSILRTTIGACTTNRGFGGAILFDNVTNIIIQDVIFEQNIASEGAGMACINGGGTITIGQVSFVNNRITNFYSNDVDIYSDGSCEDSFWYSQTACPIAGDCSSCETSICSVTGIRCYCYSGDINTSHSSSPTPSISMTNRPTESISSSVINVLPESSNDETNPDDISTIVIVSIVIIGIICAVLIIGGIVVYTVIIKKKQYEKDDDYDTIDSKPPNTPQREEDDIYQ